jgi:hypothetical protein
MSVAALRAEVNRRVQERLVPVLFDRMVVLHQKWNWRDCSCSWCQEKRINHDHMQFAPHYMNRDDREMWREGRRRHTRAALVDKAKVVVTGE